MPYVTMPILPTYKQLTLDDLLSGEVSMHLPQISFAGKYNTRTREVQTLQKKFVEQYNIPGAIARLEDWLRCHESLAKQPRGDLYSSFLIPKSSGGTRRIDAPNEELKTALRELKGVFENEFHAMYHTSAFAYVKGRSIVDALKRHQKNQSWWYLKMDFSNFFGSTSAEFILSMLQRIFPFSEAMKTSCGYSAISQAVDLCCLGGVLPQGTPISPMLTNLVMLPIDYEIGRELRKYQELTGNRFVYTRYADDILISGKQTFRPDAVQNIIGKVLRSFFAPYQIKPEKTRYGSRNGRNWNLGLMIGKDNQITVGRKRKLALRALLNDYCNSRASGNPWSLCDVQTMAGQISYFRMVEPDYIDEALTFYDKKYGLSIMACIQDDLKGG